jgi:hypothetical protein
MVAFTSTRNTNIHQLADQPLEIRHILAARAGSVELRVVPDRTDDERRAAAAASISDAQLALVETNVEPMQ